MAAAIVFAMISGAAFVASVNEFGGGFDEVRRWLWALAAALSAALAIVFQSYAPAGANYVHRSRRAVGGTAKSLGRMIRHLFSRGYAQITVGGLLTALGIYYTFDFGEEGRTSRGVGWASVTAVGALLMLAGLAVLAKVDPPEEGNMEMRTVRRASWRARQAASRALGAAIEARAIRKADADAAQSVSSLAKHASTAADEVLALEAEAEQVFARLLELAALADERARDAESDLGDATATLERLEKSHRQSRAEIIPPEMEPESGSETPETDERDEEHS